MADLDRSSLPERLADILEEEIRSGVWKDRLPGYRVLCEKYGVSRPTCEAAFRILENQGILGPVEPRRTRKIIAQQVEDHPLHRRHLLVVTDRMHFNAENRRQLTDPITRHWKKQGGEISHVEADFGRSKTQDQRTRARTAALP